MEKFNLEEELEAIEEKAIAKHERLHKLFKENRFAFEIERKRMINEVIESANSKSQEKRLRAIQNSWDNKMKKAGSKNNRLVLAQHLFWEHFNNTWNPLIQECSKELRGMVGQKA